MKRTYGAAVALALLLVPVSASAGTVTGAQVERIAPDRLKLSWADAGMVDVYMADGADVPVNRAILVSRLDGDGTYEQTVPAGTRPYFLVRDHRSGATLRVSERLVPLDHGSNFRDVGGYVGAGGKHVRWGMIYRSGATPLISDADAKLIAGLHLANMVDLRSSEERQLAPTKIEGVPYHAVGYSMATLMAAMRPAASGTGAGGTAGNGAGLYSAMPEMLAPQIRLLFGRLLAKEGPVVFNCSAGQDRTGFAAAMILSALAVPRDVIIADYHLSTQYRRPEYEMGKIDPNAFPDNVAAQMFARYHANPAAAKPQILKTPDGKPLLAFAFDAIDQRYGSVDAYLEKVVGLTKVDIAALRVTYLE